MRPKYASALIFIAMTAAVVVGAPIVCGREGAAFFDGDVQLQRELALGQARWVEADLTRSDFQTGVELFDGEWYFGTYMMSALGFGQVALQHPELAQTQLPLIEACLDKLLSDSVREFDTLAWQEDALTALPNGRGHAAYLGYLNLALGIHRQLAPASRFAAQHDAISGALRQRLEASPSGLIETYPGEAYPVDSTAAAASVVLHAIATGAKVPPFFAAWFDNLSRRQVDRGTGLLIQAASHDTGAQLDRARGSGTALAAYFASFAHAPLARDLHRALRSHLATAPLGFGLVREYAVGEEGNGDIDSGPLLFGYSVSATGFSLGSARATGDRTQFLNVFRTANLFGALHRRDGAREFVGGGPLGNAIMFAMLTAMPATTIQGGP